MKKKFKATIALAISVAGAAGTAGLSGTGFWGGMLHNGFLAATIGGMADWFAVTALFRKPLGISYRTEIIIRNRQRIMQAIVDFAGNDLLGTDNVMKFVRQQDTSLFLREFLRNSGQEKLLPAVDRMAVQLQGKLQPEVLAAGIAPGLCRLLDERLTERLAAGLLHELSEEENARRILHLLAAAAEELLKEEEPKKLLADYADAVLNEYGEASSGRAFLMGMIGLDGERVADTLWDKAAAYLRELAEDQEAEAGAVEWLSGKIRELAENSPAAGSLSEAMQSYCSQERLSEMLERTLAGYLSDGGLARWIHEQAVSCMEQFIASSDMQRRADTVLKDWLETELRGHHDIIVGMIEERLSRLSDRELVEFTEEKVADDLQMIRINGSVVGALVGMALYAVVYTAGQVLG